MPQQSRGQNIRICRQKLIFESVAAKEHPRFTQAFKALNFYASKRVWHTRDNFKLEDSFASRTEPISLRWLDIHSVDADQLGRKRGIT